MYKTKQQQRRIGREFAKYAVPAVVGMMISSLYNIVDGVFVGRGIGQTALGAINIVFPFIMLQIAVTMLVAIGGANGFSAARGRGDAQQANQIFLQSMGLLTAINTLLNVVVLLIPETVCRLLGADADLLPYARDYLWWVALFGLVYLPGLCLSIFVRNDDSPQKELAGTLAGTVVNIVLDYLFIMRFGMGMAGAAIATGIGQTVSVVIFATHFFKKDRVLRFEKVRWQATTLKKILIGGLPSFLMEFSQSAVSFSFNIALMAQVGVEGVSYYSIVMYICGVFNMVLIGLTQGAQPIMSFSHGSGEGEKICAVRRLASKTALALTAGFYLLLALFGAPLAGLFVTNNPQLTQLAAQMMRVYTLAFFPLGVTLIHIMYYQVTERRGAALVLSFLRCFGFIQLFLLVLPPLAGIYGLYFAFFLGEGCHCLLSFYLLKKQARKNNNTA